MVRICVPPTCPWVRRIDPDGFLAKTDISQTARGNASFRAFRLTKPFLNAYKKHNFSTAR